METYIDVEGRARVSADAKEISATGSMPHPRAGQIGTYLGDIFMNGVAVSLVEFHDGDQDWILREYLEDCQSISV